MQIKGTTRVCGLIGNPVEHSLSPLIHNELAKAMDIDMAYVTFKVEENIETAIKGAYALNILGMNVTVPWKQGVMKGLTSVDPLAKSIGAVNTLVRTDNGYKGYNTDILGIKRELEEADIRIKDNVVVVLGAGGASRAISFLMASENAKKVYILNRTIDNAKDIASAIKQELNYDAVVALNINDHKCIEEKDYIVIQTTSVGLYPKCDEAPIEDMSFYENALCGVDIIYNPDKTQFMKLMDKAGKKSYNGLKMLLYQAVAAFELWNNVNVSADAVNKVYTKLQAQLKKNIILIGFMGCGKSTISEALGKAMDMEVVDTDALIEEKEKTSINEIFASKGELEFRNLETEMIKSLSKDVKRTIISVGGGLPVREENRQYLKTAGIVVYLRASIDTLENRLKGDTTRPLLKGENLRTKINTLMDKRSNIYENVADIVIDTDNLLIEDVVQYIKNLNM